MIRILKRLFRLMSQYKGRLYLGIALSMISNILGIVPIICGVWTIKLILDDSNGAAVLEPVYVLQLTTIILLRRLRSPWLDRLAGCNVCL